MPCPRPQHGLGCGDARSQIIVRERVEFLHAAQSASASAAARVLSQREGRAHALWCNPQTGAVEAVPRHMEIPDGLARKICRNLAVPEVGAE